MTGPEREDFRELRSEMRDGLGEIKGAIDGLATRVHSLELARAADDAVRADRRTAHQRIDAERRWRLGLTASVLASVLIGALNLVFR